MQIKTTENQIGKQIKSFEEYGKQLADVNALYKKDSYDKEKRGLSFLIQKEIFDQICNERFSRIEDLS